MPPAPPTCRIGGALPGVQRVSESLGPMKGRAPRKELLQLAATGTLVCFAKDLCNGYHVAMR